MTIEELKSSGIEKEIHFSFSKSGGAGGQHVNKTSSKAELRFNVRESKILPEIKKEVLLKKLAYRLNDAGELIITDDKSRSQFSNRDNALKKFYLLLASALKEKKKRKKTSPTHSSKEKRKKEKMKRKEIKSFRRKDY